MEFGDSKQAIVQIHAAGSGEVVGTGFLVAERYVLTCAHVVQAALGSLENCLDQQIAVTFLFAYPGAKQTSQVIFCEYHELNDPQPDKRGRDFAVLYLSAPLPGAIKPVTLANLNKAEDVPIKSLGFPDEIGRNLKATTRGEVGTGWIQIQGTEQTDLATEEGFSGAPVWCASAQAFVGMIVARDRRRPEAKMGFMIPTEKLKRPLRAIEWHSLLQILVNHQRDIADQITAAYQSCRPQHWPVPVQHLLKDRLLDLADMPAGSLPESRMVQFAASLLGQPGIDGVKTALLRWIHQYATDFDQLLTYVQQRQQKATLSSQTVPNPCLLISVQTDPGTQADLYRIYAWFIPDPSGYRYETGEGAEVLSPEAPENYLEEGESIDLERGIRYAHIPALVADYLDQLGRRGVDQQALTVEFFLPLTLMGSAIERCEIPEQGGFGDPIPLGLKENCAQVLVRSQDRLTLTRYRPRWQLKWSLLKDLANNLAKDTFIDGDVHAAKLKDKLLPNEAFGLTLSRLPNTSKKGEIAHLLTTGTPAALWLRCPTVNPTLCQSLQVKLLAGCLEALPKTVLALRRQTPDLPDPAALEQSIELGHHLAFLWEDPRRIPPEIDYTQSVSL
jgi:hypothetical protein